MSKLFSKPKALLGIVLVLCMILSMLPLGVLSVSADAWDGTAVPFTNGDGSESTPYQIETAEHLAYLAEQVKNGTEYSGAHFKLMDDIDLGDQPWTPIGGTFVTDPEAGTTVSRAFLGTFDGDGHTISGLYINETASGVGLFGRAAATIKNLSLEGDVKTVNVNVAGFVGYATGNVTISNCTFSGTVDGTAVKSDNAGAAAFVGGNHNSGKITIENCAAVDTTITTHSQLSWSEQGTGGLVASANSGTDVEISGSSFSGSIDGGNGVGGLIGAIYYGNDKTNPTKVTIKNSYSEGTIVGSSAGGLVGYLRTYSSTDTDRKIELYINDSYSTATAETSGLVAQNYNANDNRDNIKVEIKDSFFAGSAKYPIMNATGTTGTMTTTFDNVYYLEGSATNTSTLTPAADHEKSAAAFKDGRVVSLLNGDRDVWKQGPDYPVFELPEPPLATLTVDDAEADLTKHPFSYAQTVKSDVTSITLAATAAKDGATVAYSAVDNAGNVVTVDNGTVALAEGRTTTVTIEVTHKLKTQTYTVDVYREPTPWDGSSYEQFANYTDTVASTTKVYEIANAKQFYFFAKLFNEGVRGETVNSVRPVTLDGTVYQITHSTSWKNIFTGATVKLTADIDLGNHAFPVIGSSSSTFHAIFDGAGHEIKGLNISSSANNVALFGRIGYVATIKNLTVRGSVTATGTRNNPVGGLVAEAYAGAVVENCAFIGDVTGFLVVGGLMGNLWPDQPGNTSTVNITNCYTAGTLTLKGDPNNVNNNVGAGGLVGRNRYISTGDNGSTSHGGDAYLTNSYSTMDIVGATGCTASVTAGKGIGGLVGQFDANPGRVIYDNCYFAGSVCSPYPISTVMSGSEYDANKATVNVDTKVTINNGLYYKAGCHTGSATGAGIGDGHEYAADKFADGTVAALLGGSWSTYDGVPVYDSAPTFDIGGDLQFDSATKEYSAETDGTFELDITNTADGTKVIVSADKAEKLSAAANKYTVTTAGNGEVVVLTITVTKDKLVDVYTVTLTDPRWDGTTTKAPSGSGTSASPYLIGTAAELAYVSANVNAMSAATKYFKLTADIDLGGHQWKPIGGEKVGTSTTRFWGIFDGDGHTIKGLYYNDVEDETHVNHDGVGSSGGIGLFGRVTPGYNTTTIKNLHVEGTIISSRNQVGGIVGYNNGGTLNMENCSFSGIVRSGANNYTAHTGGLIGYSGGNVNMTNCYTTGEVTGQKMSSLGLTVSGGDNPEHIGGLIGYVADAADSNGIPKPVVAITNCYSTATVTGTDGIGGLVGTIANSRTTSENTVTITGSYTAGALVATGNAGGLVGQIRVSAATVGGVNLNISDSYSLCDLSKATNAATGGLFGTVYHLYYADGTTKANTNINLSFDNCYYAGSCGTNAKVLPIMYLATGQASENGYRFKTLSVNNVYYRKGSSAAANAITSALNKDDGTINVENVAEKTIEEFANGTVSGSLGEGWATSVKGYPIHSTFVAPTDALVKIGTSIRTFSPTGMRFYFKMDTAAQIAGLKEYGVVLSKASNATNGLFVGGNKTAKAIAYDGKTTVHVREDVVEGDKTYDYFTALLNFSSDKNFETAYNARAYALYTDADGQEIVVYSPVTNTVQNGDDVQDCTLYNIASMAYDDYNNGVVEFYPDEVAYLEAILKKKSAVLSNTYLKLKTQETLNVAYLGGSVTDGHGSTTRENSWRRLTSKWLESTYGVTVNEVSGAIGGTGTKYGAYRAVQDLKLASVTPDLVFVEFSVNDKYDSLNTAQTSAEAGRNMETIINTIYTYAPQADIVMVFTGDYDTMSGNKEYYSRAAHKAVADAYKIPTIDVATPLWNLMCEEKGSEPTSATDEKWLEYVTDIVHPTDKGYAEYAKTVQAFLKTTFDTKFFLPEAVVDAYKPDTTIHTLLVNPRVDNLLGETAPAGVTIAATKNGAYAIPAGAFAFTQKDAEITFTFTGTDLQLWLKNDSTGSSQEGTLTVTIDGKVQAETISLKASNHALRTVASGLDDEEHTVTIKLTSMTSESVSGIYICQFLMAGGTSQAEGVTLVSAN